MKAYGKVPNVGKGIDITKKALDWESYVRKLYSDPNAGAAAILKGPYQKLVKDRIKADLMKAMPGTPEKVIDLLAGQLAKGAVAALSSGLNTSPADVSANDATTAPNYPPAAPAEPTQTALPDWVETTVETVSHQLLAQGAAGIDVAVVTDDLRQCLLKGIAAGYGQGQTLAACEYLMGGTDDAIAAHDTPVPPDDSAPTPEPTLAPAAPPPAPPAPPPPAPEPPKPSCGDFDPTCGLGH